MEKIKEKVKKLNPDKVFEIFLEKFDTNKRIAFFTVLIIGIITHITMITEMIMSQDGLWNSIQYYRPGNWELTLGRWGIALIERFNFFMAIPTVCTISCILCMAVVAVLLIDIFQLKSKISIIFTSSILVLTPTFTATIIYIYTALAYCANFLIATLIVWFIYRFKYKKIGYVLATLCFTLVISIYQSYVGVTFGLCIMITILELIKNEKKLKEIFIQLVKIAIIVLIGAILYFIITKILVVKYNLNFANYKNFNDNLSVNMIIGNLGNAIKSAYKDFFEFFLGDSIVHNSNYRRELFYGAFFIASTIITIIAISSIKEKEKSKKIIRCILTCLFVFVIPLALNSVDLIIVNYKTYALTSPQMILIVPFIFAIFEYVDKGILLKWIAIISCLYALVTYYIAINTTYAAMKLSYNQAYSTTVRILDRIETTEGYRKDLPILFGGIIGNDNYPRRSTLYNYTIGSITINPVFHDTYHGAAGTWVKFIQIFFGLNLDLCNEQEYYSIVKSEEYKQMGCFPEENSVKIINSIVVVKFYDEVKLPY